MEHKSRVKSLQPGNKQQRPVFGVERVDIQPISIFLSVVSITKTWISMHFPKMSDFPEKRHHLYRNPADDPAVLQTCWVTPGEQKKFVLTSDNNFHLRPSAFYPHQNTKANPQNYISFSLLFPFCLLLSFRFLTMAAGCAEQQTPVRTADVWDRGSPCYTVKVASLPSISTLSPRDTFSENDQDWARGPPPQTRDSQSNSTLVCALLQSPDGHPLVWRTRQPPHI